MAHLLPLSVLHKGPKGRARGRLELDVGLLLQVARAISARGIGARGERRGRVFDGEQGAVGGHSYRSPSSSIHCAMSRTSSERSKPGASPRPSDRDWGRRGSKGRSETGAGRGQERARKRSGQGRSSLTAIVSSLCRHAAPLVPYLAERERERVREEWSQANNSGVAQSALSFFISLARCVSVCASSALPTPTVSNGSGRHAGRG